MFISRIRADAGGDRSPSGDFWFDQIGMRTASGARVTPVSAMGLPAVWACVNVLAKSFAVMPFNLWEPAGLTRKRRTDHWLYRLVCKAPNPFQSPYEWRQMLMGHLALRGNSFQQIGEDSAGNITSLLPLHPDRMRVEMLDTGSYRYRYTDQFGKEVVFLRSEIWHLRGLSNDGIVGLSPIEVAREAVGEGLAMQGYSSRFYHNDARPRGVINFDGRFADKSARQTFKESWQESQGGRNAGKIAVLEKGMSYQELKLTNADSQYLESRGANLSDIARIFGLPPHKVGDLSKSTNNNIEHQSIEFWTDAMHPWGCCVASSMEFALLGPDTTLDCEFDIRPLMRGDGKTRSERLNRLVLGGILKPNEGRAEEGYDPEPGGDVLLRPLNMGTVNDDGSVEAPEPPEVETEDTPGGPTQPGGESPDGTDRTGPESRMVALLAGNANRMARRIVAGSYPTADVLAEAMAVDRIEARRWIQRGWDGVPEEEIAADLMTLAGAPMIDHTASAIRSLATAIAERKPAQINVHPAAVTVQPADVNVTVQPAQVSVEAPEITMPATVVHVPAPNVNVTVQPAAVEVQAAAAPVVTLPAPVVNVEVKPSDVHIAQQPAPSGGNSLKDAS